MRIEAHRLVGALQFDSPNQDERPFPDIELIVVHGISLPAEHFGGDEVERLFMNELDSTDPGLSDLAGMRVSSHLFIRRDGTVMQFVPFDRRAWHAGDSSFHGRRKCNDFSVGIELEGTDLVAYEEIQYEILADVCAVLMHHYGAREIAGHQHIAPGRKTDPGPSFNFVNLKRRLAAKL
jgi:AmpD protein